MKESEKLLIAAKAAEENELREFVKNNPVIENFGIYLEPHSGKKRIIAVDRNMKVILGRCTDRKKAEKKISDYVKEVELENHSAKSGWGQVVKDMRERYEDSSVIKFLHDELGKNFLIICKVMEISITTTRRKYAAVDENDYKKLCEEFEYLITGIV